MIRRYFSKTSRSSEKIIQFSDGLDADTLNSDAKRFDAILFNLQVIGEAVNNLPKQFRDGHPQIAGRDFVAHAYFSLDLDILWDAIQHDVPTLFDNLKDILASGEKS